MRTFYLLSIFVLMMYAGCSGGGGVVAPVADEHNNSATDSLNNLPVVAVTTSEDGSFNAIGLMGAYELNLDMNDFTADLVSKRLSSLGESWIVSGIGFFTISPCSNCLRVSSIALTADGNLQLKFAISHPFDPGIVGQPPTWKNRLDLDVFDVALVVVPIGTTATNYPLTIAGAYTGILINNAGFTTELANVIGDNKAMPYALVVDDNISGLNTNNKFAMGADSFFDVFFDINHMTSFRYDMYLTMGYGWSAKKPERLNPRYCIPEFNRKPAWKVKVTPPNGNDPPSMLNTWNDGDGTTPRNVTVEVFDWQQGMHVDPALTLQTDIYAASDVSRVTVEIPGMTTALPTAVAPPTGTGKPTDPLVYVIPVANEKLLPAGEYMGLVKVSDQRVPPNPIGDAARDYLIDVPDGVVRNNYPMPEFATYQTFVATVVISNWPPVARAVATTATNIIDGMSVTFNATASYDPDGIVVSYEWDFNDDGVFAGVGDSYTGSAFFPSHVFTLGDGTWNVQLRVTDDRGATDTLDNPILITVDQSKNKKPRPGYDVVDIATILNTNEVLIMFEDNQVWLFNSILSTGSLLFTMPGSLSNQRIEACVNGDSICGWWDATSRNTYSYLYNGTLATAHNYTNLVPLNVENLCLNAGTFDDYQADLSGYTPPTNAVWWNRYAPPDYTNGSGGENWDWSPGTGNNNLNMNYVKGTHAGYDVPQFWVLEGDPEYRVEKLNFNPFIYLGGGWGGPSYHTNDDNGFWNPQDITSDSLNHVFVLDILSDGTRKIKKFGPSGAVYGSFGDNYSMENIPTRIEAAWATNWLYVAMGEMVSIFLPSEMPS